MAVSKVYFFKAEILKDSNSVDCSELKSLFLDVVKNEGKQHEEEISFDIQDRDGTHQIIDVKEYKGSRLYARLTKQHPSNSYMKRDYETLAESAILADDETQKGIEHVTFCGLDYEHGILAIVLKRGAPNEKIFSRLIDKYKEGYELIFTAIPNREVIDSLYSKDGVQIAKMEIELPVPDAHVLESILHWTPSQIEALEESRTKGLKSSITLFCNERGKLSQDKEGNRNIISAIKTMVGSNKYHKAKLRAKTVNANLRDYDFFESKFSYEIDIALYRTDNERRQYLTLDELFDEHVSQLKMSFSENMAYLLQMVQRD